MLKKTTETDARQQQDENQIHLNDLAARIAEHQQAGLHHVFECEQNIFPRYRYGNFEDQVSLFYGC